MKQLFLLICLTIAPLVNASEIITWESLKPAQTPYQMISSGDQALISEIYAYEVMQQTRQLSSMELDGYNQRVALAEKLGLEVRDLIEQREESIVLTDLAVSDMLISGFLVPLENKQSIGKQFILVPTAGACIHTPAPPVNQTIFVEFPEGYELESIYTRVWVKGDIKADSFTTSVALSDGSQMTQVGYMIDASNIVTYL